MTEPRIVSLIASSTEIVSALGFESSLVGRSHECDYPAAVIDLPVCTEPKFDPHGTSLEIDERVKAILRDALSVYRVRTEALEELRPDVIVTQSQCEVCAVSLKDVELAVCELVGSRARIVSLEPNSLADVYADVRRVASALRAEARGEALVGSMRARMAETSRTARARDERPTVACVEWIEPLMAAGNWVPELVEMAGGVNLFGTAGEHAPWMRWEELVAADPDAIVVMPCGFDVERSLAELPALAGRPEWAELRAVRDRRVFVTDGNQYFNRPGPRLVESLEILAEILHPTLPRAHEGVGWRRL